MTNTKSMSESLALLTPFRMYWRKIDLHFETDELRAICFHLGVEWEDLAGDTKALKIQSLLDSFNHGFELPKLIDVLRKEKPDVDWSVRFVEPDEMWLDEKFVPVPDITLQDVLQLHYPEIWADIVQRELYKKRLNLSDLLRKIRDYFNESEFRDICFTLEISYGQLGGEHYYDKARELISHCKRNGKLSDLIKLCKELRPFIIWDYE